jgi:hypothetical protein
MPGSRNSDDFEGAPPKLSLWERLRYTMVRPDDDANSNGKAAEPAQSVEELEYEIAVADDKERNIGFVAAPVGALVGLLISGDLISHAKSLHQSTAVYEDLTYVLLGMAVLMLVTAWLRKRLFLGITTALLGLAIFNLHYWGFGVPFVMVGAWYLVRAYRLQQKLKLAGGGTSKPYGPPSRGRLPSAGGVLPRPNKRYTPPTEKRRRPAADK